MTSAIVASPALLVAGLVLVAVGWLLRSWAGRHDIAGIVTGSALEAGWNVLRHRRRPDMPQEIATRIRDVTSEPTAVGKAKKAAGVGVRHVLAQAAGLAGLVSIALGLVLTGLGLFWR